VKYSLFYATGTTTTSYSGISILHSYTFFKSHFKIYAPKILSPANQNRDNLRIFVKLL